jgi:hypothetical protein
VDLNGSRRCHHDDGYPSQRLRHPKGQLSGIVARPEYKTASLTTRTVSITPKATFAIQGSDAGFSDPLFMLEEPAFGVLVRIESQN